MAVYLLDTSVIIDVLNNKRGPPALLLELARSGHTLACCPVNITEVYASHSCTLAGFRPRRDLDKRMECGVHRFRIRKGLG
jgi:predicted nucleic acid-binding protein